MQKKRKWQRLVKEVLLILVGGLFFQSIILHAGPPYTKAQVDEANKIADEANDNIDGMITDYDPNAPGEPAKTQGDIDAEYATCKPPDQFPASASAAQPATNNAAASTAGADPNYDPSTSEGWSTPT